MNSILSGLSRRLIQVLLSWMSVGLRLRHWTLSDHIIRFRNSPWSCEKAPADLMKIGRCEVWEPRKSHMPSSPSRYLVGQQGECKSLHGEIVQTYWEVLVSSQIAISFLESWLDPHTLVEWRRVMNRNILERKQWSTKQVGCFRQCKHQTSYLDTEMVFPMLPTTSFCRISEAVKSPRRDHGFITMTDRDLIQVTCFILGQQNLSPACSGEAVVAHGSGGFVKNRIGTSQHIDMLEAMKKRLDVRKTNPVSRLVTRLGWVEEERNVQYRGVSCPSFHSWSNSLDSWIALHNRRSANMTGIKLAIDTIQDPAMNAGIHAVRLKLVLCSMKQYLIRIAIAFSKSNQSSIRSVNHKVLSACKPALDSVIPDVSL